MLEVIIAFLQTKLEALNLFTEVGGLAQLISREMEDQEGEAISVIFPAIYDGNGNHIYIDENSAYETGISYFRQTGEATEEDGEGEAPTPDDVQLKKTWPMRIVCLLPKDVISVGQDDSFITDKLVTNIESALNIDTDNTLRQSLGVDYASIRVTSVNPNKDEVFSEEFTEVANKVGHEFALFFIDFDIIVEGSKDCINNYTCEGEDLPSFVATVNDANNPDSPVSVKIGDTYSCRDCPGAIVCDLQTEINDATPTELSDALEANTEASKIAYRRPALTGQTTSFRAGDDAWRLINGIYQYDKQGKRPMLQGEDSANADGTLNDWFLLSPKTLNAFGTIFRFTDENGDRYEDTDADGIPDTKNVAGAYTNNYMIDHLTGLAYVLGLGTAAWNGAIDNAVAHSLLGFSDFYEANENEANILGCEGILPCFNWQPFGLAGTVFFWTGTTVLNTTTRAKQLVSMIGDSNGNVGFGNKSSSQTQLYVRNHYT